MTLEYQSYGGKWKYAHKVCGIQILWWNHQKSSNFNNLALLRDKMGERKYFWANPPCPPVVMPLKSKNTVEKIATIFEGNKDYKVLCKENNLFSTMYLLNLWKLNVTPKSCKSNTNLNKSWQHHAQNPAIKKCFWNLLHICTDAHFTSIF